MAESKESLVEYPVLYEFKVIGKSGDGFAELVERLLALRDEQGEGRSRE